MKSFIKKNIKFIIIVVICITCSVLTTFATDYLFNSSEVYYNNTTSGIQADRVQGAIDELYACASNYAAYNQRLTSAETTIGSGSLTTTSQNLIGAVNGLNEQIANVDSKICYINNTLTGTKHTMSSSGSYTAPINLFVSVNVHVVASSSGAARVGINGTSVNIIDIGGTNGACNFWVSCAFPMKAGQTLAWNLNTNATDSNYIVQNIKFG